MVDEAGLREQVIRFSKLGRSEKRQRIVLKSDSFVGICFPPHSQDSSIAKLEDHGNHFGFNENQIEEVPLFFHHHP